MWWQEDNEPDHDQFPWVLGLLVFAIILAIIYFLGAGLPWILVGAFFSAFIGVAAQSRLDRLRAEKGQYGAGQTHSAPDGFGPAASDEAVTVVVKGKITHPDRRRDIRVSLDLVADNLFRVVIHNYEHGNWYRDFAISVTYPGPTADITLPRPDPDQALMIGPDTVPDQAARALYDLGQVIAPCTLRVAWAKDQLQVQGILAHELVETGTVSEMAELMENLNRAILDHGLFRDLAVAAPIPAKDFKDGVKDGTMPLEDGDLVNIFALADRWEP